MYSETIRHYHNEHGNIFQHDYVLLLQYFLAGAFVVPVPPYSSNACYAFSAGYYVQIRLNGPVPALYPS